MTKSTIGCFLPARRLKRTALSLLILAALVGAGLAPFTIGQARAAAPVLQGSYNAGSSFYQAGIAVSDINADGKDELLVGNQDSRLYCFDAFGNVLWMYGTKAAIQGTPACADVDHDGRQEVFVGDMLGRMWGFDYLGQPLVKWGWPRQTVTTGGLSGIFSSPAVGDINGDGLDEIVVGTYGQRVYAWTYNGQELPGWPFNNEDTIWSSPALADIDYDGLKEVVIGADSTGGPNWPYPPGGLLYVLEEDASVAPGFPKYTPEVTWSSPAVGDIDGDGRYEIVVGTGHYYTATGKLTFESQRVYAYKHDGSTVPGWPAVVAGSTFSSPAVGDVDGDGTSEIVVGSVMVNRQGAEKVSVIEPNGRLAAEVNGLGGPTMGSPALGDVNSDGVTDIVLGSGQRFYAWDGSGNELWNMYMNNFVVSNPGVGDFDRDGSVEAAVVTGDAPGGSFPGGKFYVYDCGPKAAAPGGDAALFPWPMFRKTPDHRAAIPVGNEPPPPPPAEAKKWYLAEGSTGPGMETWVTLLNPGTSSANVRLTYMTPGGAVSGPRAMMPPETRCSFNVGERVPNTWEVSTMVSSDTQIVAERTVYGNNRGWAHNSVGAPAAKQTWYLAEGSTGPGMETWVTVQNPNSTTATVSLSFQTDRGLVGGPRAVVATSSRRSFNLSSYVPNHWGVSTKVDSDIPVIAERSVYGNNRTWATGSVGAPLPATRWFLAEGSTGAGMQTYILVQNPKHPAANCHVDYMTTSGMVAGPSFTVGAGSRQTINAADTVNGQASISAVVTSDVPVVVERSVYGSGRAWGTDSVATVIPKKTWYMAEGSTGGGMETWVSIQNPNAESVRLNLSYVTPSGRKAGPGVFMPPLSRCSIFVADTVPDSYQVSTVVSADKPVIAERAMYGNNRTWGHGSVGFAP